MSFDVISSTLKTFSRRTCRLFHNYIRCAIGKLFFDYAKNIVICPSVQIDPSYMITPIPKYNMYDLSKSLPIPCSYTHPSLSLTWLKTVKKGLLAPFVI